MATRRQYPFLTIWQPEGNTLFSPYGNQKVKPISHHMATGRQHPFLTIWQPEGKTLFSPDGNQKVKPFSSHMATHMATHLAKPVPPDGNQKAKSRFLQTASSFKRKDQRTEKWKNQIYFMKLAYLSEESDFTRNDYEVTLRFIAKSGSL